MQIRCNFPDISYLSETQKNYFQFLNKINKPLVVYRFPGNVITALRTNDKIIMFLKQKWDFKIILMSHDK